MNTATLAADHAAPRKRSWSLLSGSFALFNFLRIFAYLPTLLAIQSDGHAEQHSLFTWLAFLGANLTMALWLHEQDGRRLNPAVAFNVANALLCGAIAATIAWLCWMQPTSTFSTFF